MGIMLLSKSPTINFALASVGILTPLDVVNHLPRRYDSFLYTPKKSQYDDKERVVKKGYVVQKGRSLRFNKRSLTSFYFKTTDEETFLIEAWNRPYLASSLKSDELITISGIYEKRRSSIALLNLLKGEIKETDALKPIYALPNAVPNYGFAHLVKKCLALLDGKIEDKIPHCFKEKYRLLSHYEALKKAHSPSNYEDLRQAKRTLKYEEALSFTLKSALIKETNRLLTKDAKRKINYEKVKMFIRSLPFHLSSDQVNALKECFRDMDSPAVMYRLLQGDVGTGKTLVAALLSYANFTRGEQTALLAPTDTLAKQHYENFKKLFAETRVNISLLTGSLHKEERNCVLSDLATGTTDIVIGTHALFSKDVNYAYLGLVVIDEQHKFGVNQRASLLDKGEHADLLLMSATPIPRTLAFTIYGDLDVSTLSQFPQGKRNVITRLIPENDPLVDSLIKKSLSSQHRVYIVAPQIEGDGKQNTSAIKIAEMYRKKYGDKVTLCHGKLDEESKETSILSFQSGLTPIMVATSLVEVGIDVKEADLMIIYSPSHFSLSSLHQLRGRVGRGGEEARCLLLYSKKDESENEKLRVLEKEDDGFKIAEEDMRLRGPGEMAGTRQSGLPTFGVASIMDDFKIFEVARDDARKMLFDKDNPDFAPFIEKAKKEINDISLA